MTTTLSIIALVIFITTLYFLKDTITEALSGGKSFMPTEMRGFNDGRTFKKTAEPSSVQKSIKNNKLIIVLIDTASVLVLLYIVVKIGSLILQSLNL